jgi:hypothetical protein
MKEPAMARTKDPVVEETAVEVTPEVASEPEHISASTLAEMEAGRATLAKLAESAKAE